MDPTTSPPPTGGSAPQVPGGDVLDEVREAAARVSGRARWVQVDEGRVATYADELLTSGALEPAGSGPDAPDPWTVDAGASPDEVEGAVALVVALDTVNFGSGWHPSVRKRPGCSGATTMAANLRAWVDAEGPIRAERLAGFEPGDAHRTFDQPRGEGVDDLMALFAAALADLGRVVLDRHDGRFTDLVASAGGSAAALVQELRRMPSFDDVATHDGEEVPILKRAQITVADLHRTFTGSGPGHFPDVDRLTAFADNLVPHVLRLDGVLHLDADLVARIDAGTLLEAGSEEEVEIRAVGLHAVELVRGALAERCADVPSWHLDQVLWRRGGAPSYKAHPRHRARSPYY